MRLRVKVWTTSWIAGSRSRAAVAVLAGVGLAQGLCSCALHPSMPTIDPTLAAARGPGRWQSVDLRTLSFNGAISEATPAQFAALLTASIEQVVLNSGGGDVNAALTIAQELRRRELRVRIDGYCLSSCANYWAVAAKSVSFDEGVIGLHGNISSCVQLYGGVDAYLAKDFPRGAPAHVRAQVESALNAEERFYATLRLDRFALVETCRPDKGRGGAVIAFVVPSRATAERLGMHITPSSESSLRLIAAFNRWSREPMVVEGF